ALDAGAIGFSSSWGDVHADHLGSPVPSRFATSGELVRLAARLRGRSGTMLEFIPGGNRIFAEPAIEAMVEMAVAAGRPLNWNALGVDSPATIDARLGVSDRARAVGATIVALTLPVPLQLRVNLLTSIAYNDLPTWSEVRILPIDERLKAMADP